MRRAIANGQLATVQNKERSVCRLAGQGLTIQTQGYTDTIDRCTAFQLQTALGQIVMTAVHKGCAIPFRPADALRIVLMGMLGRFVFCIAAGQFNGGAIIPDLIVFIIGLKCAYILCIRIPGEHTGSVCQRNTDLGILQNALHIYQLTCRQIQIGCISSDFCAAADMNFRQAGICSHHQTIDLSSGHIQRTGNIHITTGIFIGITACDTTTGHI